MFLTLLALASTAYCQFPSTNPSNGGFSQVRIFNDLAPTTGSGVGSVFLASATTTSYAGPAAVVAVVTRNDGATTNVPTLTVNTGFGAYQDFDLTSLVAGGTASSSANVEFRQGSSSGPVLCSGITVSGNQRVTITLSSTLSPQVTQSGTCVNNVAGQVNGGSCTINQQELISFTCTPSVDPSLDARTCDSYNLDIFRDDTFNVCDDLKLERTAPAIVGLDATEKVFVDQSFAATTSTIALSRDRSYSLGSAAVANDVLSVEAFVSTAGVVSTVDYTSGYVNIANAAHRAFTNTAGVEVVDSSLFYVIRSAGSAVAPAQVRQTGTVSINQATGFVQLPVGSYSIDFFSGTDSISTIFEPTQATTRNGPAAATATVTVADGSFNVVVIKGSAQGNSAAALTFDVLDVTAPSTITEGDTDFTVYNYVSGFPVKLASATSSCCNLLNGGNNIATGGSTSVSSSSLTEDFDGQTSFTVYDSSATCGALGSSRGTVTFTGLSSFSDANGQCGRRIVLLTGRPYTSVASAVTAPAGVSVALTGCTTCQFTETRIGDLSFPDSAGSGNSVGTIVIDVPSCACTAVSVATCDSICDADEFASLESQLSAGIAQITASVTSSTTSITRSVNTVLTASQGDSDTINNIEELIEDDVLDEIDDVLDEIDDAKDEAEDAAGEAKDAVKAAEKNKDLIKNNRDIANAILDQLN